VFTLCSLRDAGEHSRRPHAVEAGRASPVYPTSAYTGVYWHAVLGDFEVWDDGSGHLLARYGSLEVRLRPRHCCREFSGVPTGQAWSMLLPQVHVHFSTVDNDRRYRNVSVHLIKRTVFERRADDRAATSRGQTATAASPAHTGALAITLLLLLF